ncbi:hypothetical protein MTBUT4_620007 [Magnetospirillum sp. UT-4]|nr:hypothetical protein MTBUT4_620007 [Magnetospirillum sp. UT-4]
MSRPGRAKSQQFPSQSRHFQAQSHPIPPGFAQNHRTAELGARESKAFTSPIRLAGIAKRNTDIVRSRR